LSVAQGIGKKSHGKTMSESAPFFHSLKENNFFNEQYQLIEIKYKPPRPTLSRAELYRKWLDAYLPSIGVRMHPGAPFEGLRGVYQLVEQLDGAYMRQDELKHLLHQCHALTPIQQEKLAGAINRVFQLIEQTDLNPERLVEMRNLEIWWALFPERQAWRVLEWLRSLGLEVPCSRDGFRAWSRVVRGHTPKSGDHPREWVQKCRQEGAEAWGDAINADRAAARFAGVWSHSEEGGPCMDTPDCENCFLQKQCRWKQGGPSEEMSTTDLIRKEYWIQIEEVDIIENILNLDRDEKEALEELGELGALKALDRNKLTELQQKVAADSELPTKLRLLKELCRRYAEKRLQPSTQYRSSSDIFAHLREQFREAAQEQFLVVLLDNKHRVLEEVNVTQGLLNKSLVHPREVFARAVEARAAALVCVHNHPSGDPEPSPEDRRITERLVESGKLIGIQVLDHVVIGRDDYFSFADKGLL